MRRHIAVVGSSHLATVVTGCLLDKGYTITVVDNHQHEIDNLKKGKLPIHEPGLEELIQKGIKSGKVTFTTGWYRLREADIIYVAKDAAKTEEGVDLEELQYIFHKIAQQKNTPYVLMISTQMPVGTNAVIKTIVGEDANIAIVPEFLRLGNAVDLFMNQDYTIIGCESEVVYDLCAEVFSNFTDNVFHMTPTEAEMSKVAQYMGVDLRPIAKALRHDKRIGPKAYIYPGLGFTGGNLERDIKVLQGMLEQTGQSSPFLDTVMRVNDHHNDIVFESLKSVLGKLNGKTIAFLGITYKSFTDTLTGSLTLKTGELLSKWCTVRAYDPQVTETDEKIQVTSSIEDCVRDADAVVVMIDKPEFRKLTPKRLKKLINQKIIFDAANMLDAEKFIKAGFKYSGIGIGHTF